MGAEHTLLSRTTLNDDTTLPPARRSLPARSARLSPSCPGPARSLRPSRLDDHVAAERAAIRAMAEADRRAAAPLRGTSAQQSSARPAHVPAPPIGQDDCGSGVPAL